MLTLVFFQVIVLLFSVMVHEVSHGLVALKLGDTTAKDAGRLTLNPLRHLDPLGSIFLPLFLASLGAPVIGWAKPVPYDPRRLKDPKRAAGLIALAGPASNLVLALIFGSIARIFFGIGGESVLLALINFIVVINLALAIFNLIPVPPLDGSGILFSLLPDSTLGLQDFLRRYGFVILILLILYGLSWMSPLVFFLQQLIAGPAALL